MAVEHLVDESLSPGWRIMLSSDGPFPILSSWRGGGPLPSREELRGSTARAVKRLLARAGLDDHVGWTIDNITAGLLLSAMTIASWEGEERALELDSADRPAVWSTPDDERVAFDWLRASGPHGDAVIQTYQDDAAFGLSFVGREDYRLPATSTGDLRPRRDVALVRGRMTSVQITYDTTAEGRAGAGVATEALLRSDTGSTLLIAGEAYSRDDWHLYDESVVALADTRTADRLTWAPPRVPWRPLTEESRAWPTPVSPVDR